jgi:hypothetical protein
MFNSKFLTKTKIKGRETQGSTRGSSPSFYITNVGVNPGLNPGFGVLRYGPTVVESEAESVSECCSRGVDFEGSADFCLI